MDGLPAIAPPAVDCDTFAHRLEQLRSETAHARALVNEALASHHPKLVLERGPRKLLLSAGISDAPYRITSFDEYGASGHRDYAAADINGMVSEVNSALRNGYAVRGR